MNRFVKIITSKENSALYWGMGLISSRVGEALGSNLSILIYSETEDITSCFYANLMIGLIIFEPAFSDFVVFK